MIESIASPTSVKFLSDFRLGSHVEACAWEIESGSKGLLGRSSRSIVIVAVAVAAIGLGRVESWSSSSKKKRRSRNRRWRSRTSKMESTWYPHTCAKRWRYSTWTLTFSSKRETERERDPIEAVWVKRANEKKKLKRVVLDQQHRNMSDWGK